MESNHAAPISTPTRPNTPTTSEYGSQVTSGEATPTNQNRVTSFAEVVQSALAKVTPAGQNKSDEADEPYDPAFPTPMEEDPADVDDDTPTLRCHL